MLITSGVHLIRFHRLEMFVIGYDAMPGRRLSCRGWASLHQLARKTPARSYRWLAGVATPCAAEPQRRPWDRWTPTLPRRYCERKERSETFENVLTIPNFLTVGRMAACPVLGFMVSFFFGICSPDDRFPCLDCCLSPRPLWVCPGARWQLLDSLRPLCCCRNH